MATNKGKKKVSSETSKKEVVDTKVKDEKKERKVVAKEKKDSKQGKNSKKIEKKPNIFKRIFQYFKEVKKEVSLVKWPSRKDMVKYSIATISFVLFFSLFFYIIDLIVVAIKTWR